MSEVDIDVAVIGAGVVGLACARALAIRGLETFVLEAESHFGSGISSRNSEVIHAGIYYPQGSLKAKLCVAGRRQLYAYIRERRINHAQCGKFIVATNPSEEAKLDGILGRGRRNGVEGLEMVGRKTLVEAEPEISACAAIASPETGIVDSHNFMMSLLGDLEDFGGQVVFKTRVERLSRKGGVYRLHLEGTQDVVTARYVVIAGGLGAQALARTLVDLPQELVPKLHYVAGRYYSLSGGPKLSHLIYPVPVDGGLGVHATIDLGGQVKFGPDVRWVEEEDYNLPSICPDDFVAAIRRYIPNIDTSRLHAAYVGIRPKLAAPGEGFKDFVISDSSIHGLGGLVGLYGIESPGLTASLAIADEVVERLL